MLTSNAPATQIRTPGRTRALSAAGGTLAAVAVWIIEVPLMGIDLRVRFGSGHAQAIGIGQIIGVSLAASLLAWLLLALLRQRTPHARAIWTGAALVALIVSLGLPFAATTTAATIGLIVMHLAVAAVVIPAMGRSWSGSPDRR
jgi:predicted permease